MSRFISDKTKRVELAGGDWVEIKASLPYTTFIEVFGNADQKDQAKNLNLSMPLLRAALVAWSFKDDAGVEVPCTFENIEKLDTQTILELLEPVILSYVPEKKS